MSMLWKHREAREKAAKAVVEPVGPTQAELEAKASKKPATKK